MKASRPRSTDRLVPMASVGASTASRRLLSWSISKINRRLLKSSWLQEETLEGGSSTKCSELMLSD